MHVSNSHVFFICVYLGDSDVVAIWIFNVHYFIFELGRYENSGVIQDLTSINKLIKKIHDRASQEIQAKVR